MSLRKAADQNCKNCVYDDLAAGTWRQQVTLCSVKNCALWPHRPKTTNPIPCSVLSYYGVKNEEYQELMGLVGGDL
jgi:hypothetical protein